MFHGKLDGETTWTHCGKPIVPGGAWPSQTDLEAGQRSGLGDALRRLKGFSDIGFVEFTTADICRHPLVEQIVRAYEGPDRTERPER